MAAHRHDNLTADTSSKRFLELSVDSLPSSVTNRFNDNEIEVKQEEEKAKMYAVQWTEHRAESCEIAGCKIQVSGEECCFGRKSLKVAHSVVSAVRIQA